MIASFGEIKFIMVGFLFQVAGVCCEATRLAMVERLLSGGEFKMDPLVSLYYFAPACAIMNFVIFLFLELQKLSMQNILDLGLFTLFANACVAFLLNVAVVFLVSLISDNSKNENALTLFADWQDFIPCNDSLRCPQRYPLGRRVHGHLLRSCLSSPSIWL